MTKFIILGFLLMTSMDVFASIDIPVGGGGGAGNPTELLACYHVVNGERRPSPYAMVPVGTQCPPCGQNANCRADDVLVDNILTQQGLPPHLCEEEATPDWL